MYGYFPPIECAIRVEFVQNWLFPNDECQNCECIILVDRSRKSGSRDGRRPSSDPDFRLRSTRIIHEQSDIHHEATNFERIQRKSLALKRLEMSFFPIFLRLFENYAKVPTQNKLYNSNYNQPYMIIIYN